MARKTSNNTTPLYVRPHACPVCEGRGIVPPYFYNYWAIVSTNGASEMCRSCQGTGIVWRKSDEI